MSAWHFVKFSADRHPNIIEGREIIKGAITREWIEECRSLWGENSPEYISRVKGEFPDSAIGAVFMHPEDCISDKASVNGRKSGKRRYVSGVDLGKHQDPTWIVVADVKMGVIVRLDSWLGLPWPETLDRVAAVSRIWKGQMWLDATGVGDPIYDELLERGLNIPRVQPLLTGVAQHKGSRGSVDARYGDLIGYKFSNESKRKLVIGLQIALENLEILLPDPASHELARELMRQLKAAQATQTAGGRTSYAAPEGDHDDAWIALALCNLGRENYRPVSAPSIDSLDTLERSGRRRGGDKVSAAGRERRGEWF